MALPFLFGNLNYREAGHGWAVRVGSLLGNWVVNFTSSSAGGQEQADNICTAMMQILTRHSVPSSIPLYRDREDGTYGPVSRARITREGIIRGVIMEHGTEHAAFLLISEAAAFFEYDPDTITPALAHGLQDRARRTLLELQIYCRHHFPGSRIQNELILREIERTGGLHQNVIEMFLEAQQPLIVLLVLADPAYSTVALPFGQQNTPLDGPGLHLSREQQILEDALRRATHRDRFHLEVIADAQIDSFPLRVREVNPTIIHFSGHGNSDGIFFSTPEGVMRAVSTQALMRIFDRASERKLRSVVMNSCYTAQAFRAGFPRQSAVLMDGTIYNNTAINFTRQLYNFIGAGLSFEEAYEHAVDAVGLDETSDLRAHLIRPNV